MINDIKKTILHNVPTTILLKIWKSYRPVRLMTYHTTWNKIFNPNCTSDYKDLPDFIDYGDGCPVDYRIPITVGKFAYWNPNRGHACTIRYSAWEIKDELNKREHISN